MGLLLGSEKLPQTIEAKSEYSFTIQKFHAIFLKVECKGKPVPLNFRVVREENSIKGGNLDLFWSYETMYPSQKRHNGSSHKNSMHVIIMPFGASTFSCD